MRQTRGVGSTYRPTYVDKVTGERKQSAVWWVRYYHRGKKYRESSESTSHADAVKLLKKRLGAMGAGKPAGPDVERTSFEDLKNILIDEYKANGRRSLARIEDALNHLEGFFAGYKAVDITTDVVTAYKVHRQEQKAANATINRECAGLKRAFRLASDAHKVAAVPKISMLDENNEREGFIEQAQFAALREVLPNDLKDPVTFLWLTGWRVGEMRTLQWRDIYSDAIRLRGENSKNKRQRELQLVGELAEVIARARAARRIECPFVFHRDGKPIGLFRKSWSTACKKAQLGGLLVHDLRRSVIRNLIRAGVSQNVAMEISGHKTANVFKRYDITSKKDVAAAQVALDQYLADSPAESKIVSIEAARGGRL